MDLDTPANDRQAAAQISSGSPYRFSADRKAHYLGTPIIARLGALLGMEELCKKMHYMKIILVKTR